MAKPSRRVRTKHDFKHDAKELVKQVSLEICANCNRRNGGALSKCRGCLCVAYCSPACQRAHWAGHRGLCCAVRDDAALGEHILVRFNGLKLQVKDLDRYNKMANFCRATCGGECVDAPDGTTRAVFGVIEARWGKQYQMLPVFWQDAQRCRDEFGAFRAALQRTDDANQVLASVVREHYFVWHFIDGFFCGKEHASTEEQLRMMLQYSHHAERRVLAFLEEGQAA